MAFYTGTSCLTKVLPSCLQNLEKFLLTFLTASDSPSESILSVISKIATFTLGKSRSRSLARERGGEGGRIEVEIKN